jgi:TatD family hydrolase
LENGRTGKKSFAAPELLNLRPLESDVERFFKMLIDSHAHLEMKDFDKDRERVIARAGEAGVGCMITVATTMADIHKALEIAQKNDSVFVSIGIHPHEVKDIREGDYDHLRSLAGEKKVVAFGEIGLDFYRNHSPREVQLVRFRELLRLGRDLGLPIILHDRVLLRNPRSSRKWSGAFLWKRCSWRRIVLS